jgi:hypothetical protein
MQNIDGRVLLFLESSSVASATSLPANLATRQ